MRILGIVALCAALAGCAAIATSSALAQAPPEQKNFGIQMQALGKRVHLCLDRQALAVAPKPVDLETASVAIMARCASDLDRMRQFLTTGIPNFTPGPDFWGRDIEPAWKKEATKAVALARTRDPTPPGSRSPSAISPPTSDKNQI
jgi:hypothetical protein